MKASQSIALAATLLFVSSAAQAGMADCEEVKASGLASQRDKCVAHAACNFVLGNKPDCAAAKVFLERTQGSALNKLAGVFGSRKPITANDVYEANLPEVAFSQDWKDRFAAVREKAAAAGTQTESYTISAGAVLYQGDMQDGKRHGWGFMFYADGAMFRGRFDQGWRTGLGEHAAQNGYRDVGMRDHNQLEGEAWARLADGSQRKGTYSKGKLQGMGTHIFPTGESYSGVFVDDKAEGEGIFTTASGEKFSRTYAANKVVAGYGAPGSTVAAAAAPAAAPVNPLAGCSSRHGMCTTACSVAGLLGALASRNADSAGTQRCLDACNKNRDECAASATPAPVVAAAPPPAPVVAASLPAGSGGGNTDTSGGAPFKVNASGRVCDGQCVLLVAETKCTHIKDNSEKISCLTQNGLGMTPETPAVCAQAKALTGCMTRQEMDSLPVKTASRSGGTYASLCERNWKKIQNVMEDRKIRYAAATNDLFLRDIHFYSAKVMEPCVGSSADAARAHETSMESYNKVLQSCAAAHHRTECTQWGSGGGVSDNGGNPYNNPAYYASWKGEVDKALSDPSYSAELGSIGGSATANAGDASCASILKVVEHQADAAKKDIPPGSVVVLSEANMWRAARSIEKIKEYCPQSERYQSEMANLESQYRDLKRACDASASRTCEARLPSKEAAPVRQVVAAPLPPLQKNDAPSCDAQVGANFRACIQQACARAEGTLRGSSCLTCATPGGEWTRCQRGSGGVNSDQ